MKNAKGGTKLS